MNRYTLAALSVTSGMLCGLAWTSWCPGLILLFGFVPFFYIENHLFRYQTRYTPNAFFMLLLPGFVIFSIMTFGWIRVISLTAAICVILTAALMMSFTLWLSYKVRLKTGNLQGKVAMIAFWLSMEYLCLKVPVLSPWINLGNGLAKEAMLIQWYEFTGVAGGTLWILLSNLLLFNLLEGFCRRGRNRLLRLAAWLAIILIPPIISIIRFNTLQVSDSSENEVVIVQPNFDPYNEKFIVPFEDQLEKVISMAEPMVTGKTMWVVTPETTIDDPVDETALSQDKYVSKIKEFVEKHPSVNFLTGMVSYTPALQDQGMIPIYDRKRAGTSEENYYFNSAFKIDSGTLIEIYHKSKLVPGFEFIPANRILRNASRYLHLPGAANRSYSIQKERICFQNSFTFQKIAPVICYESVFGEYITGYIKKGATSIFIITNDGWWKNTNGYKHHFYYASLRAIETRRPVIRSANTGISGIINIKGVADVKTSWWEKTVIRGTFIPESRITFYVKYGDFLMKISVVLSSLILALVLVIQPVMKKTHHYEESVQPPR